MNIMNEIRGCRPFPVDKDRQERCRKVLDDCGMTITELAMHLGVSRVYVSNILSGRYLTADGETRIAQFFGLTRTQLFPLRTAEEIARMRQAEAAEKAMLEKKKEERMEMRRRALEGAA